MTVQWNLPIGSSRTIPAQSPGANCVSPMYAICPGFVPPTHTRSIDEVEKEESRKSREEFLLTESLQLEKELSSLCQIRDGEILTNKEEAESLQQKLLDRKV